jgi:hypothetical protein
MSIKTALSTRAAARLGVTNVHIVAMNGKDGGSMGLVFYSDQTLGIEMSLHGSSDEMRRFAAELVRHADAADGVEA